MTLTTLDLENLESTAKTGFAHPADVLKLVAEVVRLRARVDELEAEQRHAASAENRAKEAETELEQVGRIIEVIQANYAARSKE